MKALFNLFRSKESFFTEAESVALWKKINEGDIDGVRLMFEIKPALTRATENNGWKKPLEKICEAAEEHKVVRMIEKSPWLVNCPDENGNRPLYFAARAGRLNILKAMLNHGALINASGGGGTALHAAAGENHIDCMKLLLSQEAHVDSLRGECETPLHMAAQRGHVEAIDLLIEFGADVNAKRKLDGITPLLWCIPNKPIAASHLLRHGAEVSSVEKYQGATALNFSVPYNPEIAMLMILKGADPDDKNEAGRSARDLAGELPEWLRRIDAKPTEFQEMIIRAEFSVVKSHMTQQNIVELDRAKNTSLHYAAANNRVALVELLLENGADPNAKNEYGRTPLHIAAMAGSLGSVVALLMAKADQTCCDSQGFTALDWARRWKFEDLAEELINSGSPNQNMDIFAAVVDDDIARAGEILLARPEMANAMNDMGFYPIHCAKSPEMVRLLIDHGANSDATDGSGNNALHWAAKYDDVGIALVLLESIGANISNRAGETPLAMASSPEMRTMLLERGADSSDLIGVNLKILEDAVSDTGFWDSWDIQDDVVTLNFEWVQLMGTDKSHPSQLTLKISGASHLVFCSTELVSSRWIGELRVPKRLTYNSQRDGLIIRGDIRRPHIQTNGFTLTNHGMINFLMENLSTEFVLGEKRTVYKNLSNKKFVAFLAPPAGLIVTGEDIEFTVGGDKIQVTEIESACRRWWEYWKDYWQQKRDDKSVKIDPACEATIPLANE